MKRQCEQTIKVKPKIKYEKSAKHNTLTRAFSMFGQPSAGTVESLSSQFNETRQICQNAQLNAEYWRSRAIEQLRQYTIR